MEPATPIAAPAAGPASDPGRASPPSERSRWIGRLPLLSLALFLAAIAALVWLTREYDSDEQKATLISDVLWMEQNLRFHLDRNEVQLQQLRIPTPWTS